MTWYKNLEITKKLIIGFILVALVAGIIGIVGIVSINNIDKGSREMYDNHTASMPDLGDIARNYQRQRVIIRDLYINKDINIVNYRAKEIIEARDLMVQSINNFDRRIINTEVREKFDSLTKVIGEFDEFSEDVISSIQEGDKDKAYELLTGDLAQRISRDVRILTDELMTLKSNLANENVPKNEFQDYDISYLVNDMESFIRDEGWLDIFGERVIMQKPESMDLFPPSLGNWFSYLMLFKDGNRIDLTLIPLEEIDKYLESDRLLKILLDKDNYIKEVIIPTDEDYWIKRPLQG